MVYSMRARTVRVGILAYLAFLLYLSEANILRQLGFVNLPLSFETDALESYVIQVAALVMILLGPLAVGVVKKRQRFGVKA